VTVEVLMGPVIPHRGAGVGLPGGDLDVAQVHAGIEHGRDERVLLCDCATDRQAARP
jgi:hypothetical protein